MSNDDRVFWAGCAVRRCAETRARIASVLETVLQRAAFAGAKRQRRFLRYLVEQALAGASISQYAIAMEVFDRRPAFDPAVDSIVRVEASRLRSKLRDYYDAYGQSAGLRFELPKGSYRIAVRFSEPTTNTAFPDMGGPNETGPATDRPVLDPGYAEAHARLAHNLWYRWLSAWNDVPDLEEAFAEAARAVELDDELGGGHAMVGWLHYWRGDHERAIRSGYRALELDPSQTRAMEYLSICLASCGRVDEAREMVQKAQRLNPHEPYYFPRAVVSLMAGEIRDATALLEKSTERFADFLPARVFLAMCYGLLDRKKEGVRQVAEIRRISPDFLFTEWACSWPSFQRDSMTGAAARAAAELIGLV